MRGRWSRSRRSRRGGQGSVTLDVGTGIAGGAAQRMSTAREALAVVSLGPVGIGAKITRVTGFLWDRGRDRLWRQGIDLIGDKRGGQVGKGIEDGAMFGQAEGGEFLDMTDDGFDDVAPVEQSLVEERHR